MTTTVYIIAAAVLIAFVATHLVTRLVENREDAAYHEGFAEGRAEERRVLGLDEGIAAFDARGRTR